MAFPLLSSLFNMERLTIDGWSEGKVIYKILISKHFVSGMWMRVGQKWNFSIFPPPVFTSPTVTNIYSSTEAQQFFLIKLNSFLNSLMRLSRIFWLNKNDDDTYLCPLRIEFLHFIFISFFVIR